MKLFLVLISLVFLICSNQLLLSDYSKQEIATSSLGIATSIGDFHAIFAKNVFSLDTLVGLRKENIEHELRQTLKSELEHVTRFQAIEYVVFTEKPVFNEEEVSVYPSKKYSVFVPDSGTPLKGERTMCDFLLFIHRMNVILYKNTRQYGMFSTLDNGMYEQDCIEQEILYSLWDNKKADIIRTDYVSVQQCGDHSDYEDNWSSAMTESAMQMFKRTPFIYEIKKARHFR